MQMWASQPGVGPLHSNRMTDKRGDGGVSWAAGIEGGTGGDGTTKPDPTNGTSHPRVLRTRSVSPKSLPSVEGRGDESEESPQSLSNERIYERIQRNFEMQQAIKAGQALRSPRSPREAKPTPNSSSQLAWQGPSEEEDLPLPPPSLTLQRLTDAAAAAAAAATDAPPLSSSQSPRARPGLLFLDSDVENRAPDSAHGTGSPIRLVDATPGNHRGDGRDDDVMPPERMKHGERGTHVREDDTMSSQRSMNGEKEKVTQYQQQQQQQQNIRGSSSSPQPGGAAPYASGGYPRWAETKEPIEVHQNAGVGQASPDAAASAGQSQVHWQRPLPQKVDSLVLSKQEQDAIREILKAQEREEGDVAATRGGGTVDDGVDVQPPDRGWKPAENREGESGHESRGHPGVNLERKLGYEHRETREGFEERVREGVGEGYEHRVAQAKRERYLQQAAEQRERDEALATIRASRSQRMAGDGGSVDRGVALGEAPRYHEALSSADDARTRGGDDREDAGGDGGAGVSVGMDGRGARRDAAAAASMSSSSPSSPGNRVKIHARCAETQTPPQLATTETQTWPPPPTTVAASNLHSPDGHPIRATASSQNATAPAESFDGAYVAHQSPQHAGLRRDVLLGSPFRQDASVHHHHHHPSVIYHHSQALHPDGHRRLQDSLLDQGSPKQEVFDPIRSPKHGRLQAGQFVSNSAPGHVNASPGHVHASPGHVHASPGHVHASPGHVHASTGHLRPEVSEGVALGGSLAALTAHAPVHGQHMPPSLSMSSAPSNVVLLPVILPGSTDDRISDLRLASAAHGGDVTSTGEHYANLSQHLAKGGSAVYQMRENGENYRARESGERYQTRGEGSLRGGGAGSLYGSERLVRRSPGENWENHHGSRSEDMYTSERLVRRSPGEIGDSYRGPRRGDVHGSEGLVRGSPRRGDRFRDREYGVDRDIDTRRDGVMKRNWVDEYQGYDRHEFCSVCKDVADEFCSLGCGAALCEACYDGLNRVCKTCHALKVVQHVTNLSYEDDRHVTEHDRHVIENDRLYEDDDEYYEDDGLVDVSSVRFDELLEDARRRAMREEEEDRRRGEDAVLAQLRDWAMQGIEEIRGELGVSSSRF